MLYEYLDCWITNWQIDQDCFPTYGNPKVNISTDTNKMEGNPSGQSLKFQLKVKLKHSRTSSVFWRSYCLMMQWCLGWGMTAQVNNYWTTEQASTKKQTYKTNSSQEMEHTCCFSALLSCVPCPSVCVSTCLIVRPCVRSLTTVLCLSFRSCSGCWSTNLVGLIPPIRVQISHLSVWLSDCLHYQSQTEGLNLKLQTLCTDVKHGHLPAFWIKVTLIWHTHTEYPPLYNLRS